MGTGVSVRSTSPRRQTSPPGPVDFVFRIKNPRTSASGYTAEPRHEGELPQGATFFNGGKTGLIISLRGTDALRRNTRSAWDLEQKCLR